jgi:hypothetical protein
LAVVGDKIYLFGSKKLVFCFIFVSIDFERASRDVIFMFFAKFLALAFFAATVGAQEQNLRSDIPSTVSGVTLPNTHRLSVGKEKLYRGMRPYNEEMAKQLFSVGVTDFLIFREDNKVIRIEDEIKMLLGLKIPSDRIYYIPFRWKDFDDFQTPCRQLLEALKYLKTIPALPGRGLFFHCTVGEDRTGLLAGLYRVLFQSWNPDQAFREEMCQRGYADGSTRKPSEVYREVHESLTPLFYKMIFLMEQKKIMPNNLDSESCASDPQTEKQFLQKYTPIISGAQCR